MKVYPRSTWTSFVPKENIHADSVDDLPFFTQNTVVGIMVHFDGGAYPLLNRDPAAHFDNLRKHHVATLGFSDIKWNLGVAPRVGGVWELRGLSNKGAGTDVTETNGRYVHVYCQLAGEEKPTDTLLENLVAARNLVLAKYPNATAVVGHTNYGRHPVSCPGPNLIQVISSELWDTPVGSFEFDGLEMPALREGDHNVFVFTLVSALNFLGYIRTKNIGKYDSIVSQGVRELQVDLKEGGYYKRTVDGYFGPYTRKGLGGLLKSLNRTA